MIHLAPVVLHLAQAAAPNAVTPFQFASNYVHLVAWPTICVFLWKASKAVQKFTDKVETTTNQINTMATNHMPHVQDGILELVELAKENNHRLERLIDVLKD